MAAYENLTCPECGGQMTSRKNRLSGQRFWGCNDYPNCKGTRDTDGEAPIRHREQSDLAPSERANRNDRSRWRNPA